MNHDDLKKQGAVLVKQVLPRDIVQFLTHIMLRQHHEMQIQNIPQGDAQVSDALSIMSHDIIFDTVTERIWPWLENILGQELIPTYSYARLYQNGNELKKHTDRPSCEISLSIQLGRSHHYSWPIYAGTQRFDLAEGDGMLYLGCAVPHWREPCAGPAGYYSGQVFCHYVRAQGPYAKYAGDERWPADMPFKRYRTVNMETK
jgi:hypothetical protein